MGNPNPTVLITGAAGNLGGKLRRHLAGRYALRLLDLEPGGDPEIARADLARWEAGWPALFEGVGVVAHFAADPTASQVWERLLGPNVDAVVNLYNAAARAGVRRVVFASSNHVMGGYQEIDEPRLVTTDIPPRPGTRYVVAGERRDSTAYGCAKLFAERVGRCFAESHGVETVALRIGWVRAGENLARDIPADRGPWFRQMWLSNRDFCQLAERAVVADLPAHFVVVNGMSRNPGMRWDIAHTERILGYTPQDNQ